MATNQSSWPRRWLMTDERLGDRLWEAVERLPKGAGVMFRHYSLGDTDRLELGRRLARYAAELGLVLGVAGSRELAGELRASLVHNPDRRGVLPASRAVHNEVEAEAAREAGAVLAFIAPIFPTRSHPELVAMGPKRAAKLAGLAGCPSIALGGMDEARFAGLESAHPGAFHGFAGIDCWLKG